MRRFGAILFALASAAAKAQSGDDALQWLQKMAGAAERLNYNGVVVYRSGNQTETSRVVHAVENGRELEHVEGLDGSPREILRENDEVRCVLPENRLIVVERRSARRPFPALPKENLGSLTDYYLVSKGPPARVAGIDSRSLRIEPKDDLRYGRQFWFDGNTGLLLKAELFDEKGDSKETFRFTEVRIGPVDRSALKMHSNVQSKDWRVHTVRSSVTKVDEETWALRTPLPGFRLVSSMKRKVGADSPEVTHLMYSDGLSAISVFAQPVAAGGTPLQGGSASLGAVGVYRRAVGGFQILVMGDVPLQTLKIVGDGMEVRRK